MTLATINLGKTGLTFSRLCLGTMTFGLQTDEETSRDILDTAADGGINFLDTADVYPLGGGLATAGRTEEIVGRWLKGKRKHFLFATKCVGQLALRLGIRTLAQTYSRCDQCFPTTFRNRLYRPVPIALR